MQLKLSKWVSVGGQKQYILNVIDLSVFDGGFLSIMGPSGSAKELRDIELSLACKKVTLSMNPHSSKITYRA